MSWRRKHEPSKRGFAWAVLTLGGAAGLALWLIATLHRPPPAPPQPRPRGDSSAARESRPWPGEDLTFYRNLRQDTFSGLTADPTPDQRPDRGVRAPQTAPVPPPPKSAAPPAATVREAPPSPPRSTRPAVKAKADTVIERRAARFTIQLGAYSDRSRAQGVFVAAKKAGFSPRIEPVRVSSQTWYRVRAGLYPERAAALSGAKRIRSKGFEALIVETR